MEMLNILEGYELGAMNPLASEKYHLLIEAMRRGYADRAEYMADPDFVSVPAAGMKAQHREPLTRFLEAASTKPAEELLRAVRGQRHTNRQPK